VIFASLVRSGAGGGVGGGSGPTYSQGHTGFVVSQPLWQWIVGQGYYMRGGSGLLLTPFQVRSVCSGLQHAWATAKGEGDARAVGAGLCITV